jgi:3',5'-cyclic AMP phosphodiesterase CpdA
MKLILFSDPHITQDGLLYGLDPRRRLRSVVSCVKRDHSDAALCVGLGDLTHTGRVEEYEALKSIVGELECPVRLIAGNHDSRDNLARVFLDHRQDGAGNIQSELMMGDQLLLFLDTTSPWSGGEYDETRARWFANRVAQAEGRPIIIFMHHPPFAIQVPTIDATRLVDAALFERSLAGANVKHLFFGHVHRLIAGSWKRIPVTAFRGTSHQRARSTTYGGEPFEHGPPYFAVAHVGADHVVIHMQDVMVDPLEGRSLTCWREKPGPG